MLFLSAAFVACADAGPGTTALDTDVDCDADADCSDAATPDAAPPADVPGPDTDGVCDGSADCLDAATGETGEEVTPSPCGDGRLDPGEVCDDGNPYVHDGCELCDVRPGWECAGAPSVCVQTCGNGRMEPGEECDDGNAEWGDGCDYCHVGCAWVCSGEPSSCEFACGNGVVDDGEECDDGSRPGDDGCRYCRVERRWSCDGEPSVCDTNCGNGVIDDDEECDGGAYSGVPGCDECDVSSGWTCDGEPSVCELSCGNGRADGGETCDDGNTRTWDGCGSCDIEYGWECDGWPSACRRSCGDGDLDGGEACDDGNSDDTDGCSWCWISFGWGCEGSPSRCAPLCGNGARDPREECDDANELAGDGCSDCIVDDGWYCAGMPSICEATCVGVSCASLDDACHTGLCDLATGECVAQEMDCSALDSGCSLGRCVMATGECETVVAADETPCSAESGSFSPGVCVAGACVWAGTCEGRPEGAQCGNHACRHTCRSGECLPDPAAEGAPCADLGADVLGTCLAGSCVGGDRVVAAPCDLGWEVSGTCYREARAWEFGHPGDGAPWEVHWLGGGGGVSRWSYASEARTSCTSSSGQYFYDRSDRSGRLDIPQLLPPREPAYVTARVGGSAGAFYDQTCSGYPQCEECCVTTGGYGSHAVEFRGPDWVLSVGASVTVTVGPVRSAAMSVTAFASGDRWDFSCDWHAFDLYARASEVVLSECPYNECGATIVGPFGCAHVPTRPDVVDCDGACRDLSTDMEHCGSCRNACNPLAETCVDGVCVCDAEVLAANPAACSGCPHGYEGRLCDQECPGFAETGLECSGRGTCRAGADGAVCRCELGATGADCSRPCCADGGLPPHPDESCRAT